MTEHRTGRRRIAAAALAVALTAAIGFAAPGIAHEGHKVKRVIVITDGDAKGHDLARMRSFSMDLEKGLAGCDGVKSEVSEATGEREKTRILICDESGKHGAEARQRLEQALARIQSNDALSAEHKARVTAALRRAIDRLASAN